MSNIIFLNQNQIQQASIYELKDELSRSLKITSDHLIYISVIWLELDRRGEDLSALKSGLFEYIPLIATNKLDARLVVDFAGNKNILTALARLDIEEQNKIAETKTIPFVQFTKESGLIETELNLTTAKPRQIYQVFGGDLGLRSINEQILFLKAKSKVKIKASSNRRQLVKKVSLDEKNEYLLLGENHKIKVESLLQSLGDLYEIDMFELMSKYSKRIANK